MAWLKSSNKKTVSDTWRGAIWEETKAWGRAVNQVDRDFSKSTADVASEFLTGKMPKNKDGKKTVTIKIVR